MNKLAQVVIDDSLHGSVQEMKPEAEQLIFKKQKEDEIRYKLAEFARELSRAKLKRNKY
jgi:hypothetical protein